MKQPNLTVWSPRGLPLPPFLSARLPRKSASRPRLLAVAALLLALSPLPAFSQGVTVTSLGTGTAALLGGDLTDPEDDGIDVAGAENDLSGNNWNFVDAIPNEERGFEGGEFALNIFDNQLGGGNAKWCCNARNITIEFPEPFALTHFTIASANDTPNRDWQVWRILGSTDGVTFTTIYEDPGTARLWNERLEVLRFDLDVPAGPYTFIRLEADSNWGDGLWQIGEVEIFGEVDVTDTDGDGMPDFYEDANGLDKNNAADASSDTDGDGLTALREYQNGTNPQVADTDSDGLNDGDEVNTTNTNPLDDDTDGDGLTDGDEVSTHNTNPLLADTDGDSFDDGLEIAEGSDPNDAGSVPQAFVPAASLTWRASEDTDGDNLWQNLEYPNSTVMAWNLGAPTTPTTGGVSNFAPVTSWYSGLAATMESLNDGEFSTTFNQPTNKPVSFELVFRPGDFDENHVLFETGGNGDGFGIVLNGDTVFFRAQDANADDQRVILSHQFSAGDDQNFHHVVATLQPGANGSSVAKLYVNGAEVASVSAVGTLNDWAGGDNSGMGVLTGSTPTGQTDFSSSFPGDIAQFRFWADRILTPAEVQNAYDKIAVPPSDDDSDGLPDAWEMLHFGNLDQTAAGDPDSDGLNSGEELALGTLPADSDTDMDGINDGDETTGAANPYSGGALGAAPGDPTNPRNPDSDGDGLFDGAEVDNANGSVSDPNNPDTDGDLYPDGIEVDNNSDPTDPNSTPGVVLITVRGTGTSALRGGDLTDPENDGVEGNVPADNDWSTLNWNWVSIEASSENYFGNFGGSEGAYDVFDNTVGAGQAKWCCGGAPQWITVEFEGPVSLTSFTVTSGNDVEDRDPRVWSISGSNDGVNFTPIFEQDDPGQQLWTERLQVLEFTLPTPTIPYRYFRYDVFQTNNANHQINEIEYFGFVDTTDTDGDGIPDWYEDLYAFLDPNNAADAALDEDGDSLDNGGEYAAGSDPSNPDSDGDGLSDGEEVVLGTNPTRVDTDGDGYSDGFEVSKGSDPLDAGSVPGINPITFQQPADITGSLADLDLTGTLVHAWNGGSNTVTVAGIQFVPGPSLGTEESGRDPRDRGGDADYETLLDSRTASMTRQFLTIPGLTPGADYQIQIWTADTVSMFGELYGFSTDPTFLDFSQIAELEGGDDLGFFPAQYVIGNFTADATTQALILEPFTTGGVMYSAMMIRQIGGTPPSLELTGVARTGANTFELTWTGGDGTNEVQGSVDGQTWNTIASGVASPATVAADPSATPLQIFRVVEP